MVKSIFKTIAIFSLIALALVGWVVLLTQNPIILARARFRYIQAVRSHVDFKNGPCLGKISDDWFLDIAHIPRMPVDDLPQNQCQSRHFVEMSPKGEVIVVR